jgi:polyferredoxin
VLGALLFAGLRETFCATVCPYAKLQGVLMGGTSCVAYAPPRSDCIDWCLRARVPDRHRHPTACR